ncbi:hypothetical protein LguiB_025532 [Lonicera macranthoides]
MSSSDQVKEVGEKEWRIRMERELKTVKNELSLIKSLMVDKEFIKRERNSSDDNCYGDDDEFSFMSRKKLKSSNDDSIKIITHQVRRSICTTPVNICLFEDFKLKNTFRAKKRELLEYIFSKSVKQDQLIVASGDHSLLRFDFRYLGPNEEIESEVFIPILISRHYILARVLLKTKVVEVWDSLSDATQPILYSARIKDILRNLDLGLEREIRKKPGNFSFSSFRIVRASFVPRQPNGFDCGMFVILFMQSGCKVDSRSFVFDSNEERCRLACWLVNSNYNKHRDILMNDVREFYLKMNM